ncbi:hypothetical protein TNCV_977091 [Trichonephila clavipes]|nr:hypothetical protein TNCV_977091 [Trichonephila clavipes]
MRGPCLHNDWPGIHHPLLPQINFDNMWKQHGLLYPKDTSKASLILCRVYSLEHTGRLDIFEEMDEKRFFLSLSQSEAPSVDDLVTNFEFCILFFVVFQRLNDFRQNADMDKRISWTSIRSDLSDAGVSVCSKTASSRKADVKLKGRIQRKKPDLTLQQH